MKRDVRALHDRAGAHGELLAAIAANEHASLRLACHPMNVEHAAMRACRTIGPAHGFDVLMRGLFVMEDFGGKID